MSGRGRKVTEASLTKTGQVQACIQAVREGAHSEVYKSKEEEKMEVGN